jgi:UDP-N-acetylmuramyl pentapeptide phosphotransferase/UDP-N-acetylglucosamine-1-phosphate transferase
MLLGASFLAALVASLAATGALLVLLRRLAILDHPNPRSSHARPTPRGGGLAVMAVVLASWAWVARAGGAPAEEAGAVAALCLIALALAGLFWIDDLRGLPIAARLAGQAAAVGAALAVAPGPYFGGLLPPALDAALAAFAWLWFVNLFNFMDGVDGISGVQAGALGLGAAVVAGVAGLGQSTALYGATAAGAALGFLWWNWQPARVFLGDVGSVGLGFVLGWLLLSLSARGQWAAAVILALYYLADATLTLVGRALRRQPVWRAHREHYYQRAVRLGRSHAAVALSVLAADLALVGAAALAAAGFAVAALAAAGIVVAALLRHLAAVPAAPSSARP